MSQYREVLTLLLCACVCVSLHCHTPSTPYITSDILSILQLPSPSVFFYPIMLSVCVCVCVCITLMERVIDIALNKIQHAYLLMFSAETLML